MTFRRRIALVAAAAVAIAIAVASVVVYVVVRGQLRAQVDDDLRELAAGETVRPLAVPAPRSGTRQPELPLPVPELHHPLDGNDRGRSRDRIALALPEQPLGVPGGYGQLIGSDGEVIRVPGASGKLPVSDAALQVARGRRPAYFADIEVGDSHLRVLTEPAGNGQAIQVARSLDEVEGTLSRLRWILVAISLAGVGLAALLGRVIARTAIAPVIRLQRQIVADASHELRTPLTSLRTNIELLGRENGLSREDRDRLLGDLVEQVDELGLLVGNLIDLAREEERPLAETEVRLDELVADAVTRARRRSRDVEISTRLEPCLVRGVEDRLDRAVANLLDNAVKWSPPESEIEVSVTAAGEVAVRDYGPGIAADDLERVFDRFYRAAAGRHMPGSGLGLAIVRQIAEAHRGSVEAEAPGDRGARFVLRLPPVRISAGSSTVLR